jgi:hypothetical protein
LGSYDLVIAKMSKIRESYEKTWMEFIPKFKSKFPSKIVFLYQEAEVDWPLKRSIEEQCELYKAIKSCDLFLSHNEIDAGFYGNLWDNKKAIYTPTPLPINAIKKYVKTFKYRQDGHELIFGSSFDDRACGMFGLSAALGARRIFDAIKLTQYTRTDYKDNRNDLIKECFGDFETIPQLSWFDYCERLSRAYVSMSLMTAAAAGRDTITFAALGVPHIGNKRLTAMQSCFPDLCIDPLDVDRAKSLVVKLFTDAEFNSRISDDSKRLAEMYHSFDAVGKYLKQSIKNKTGISL